MIAAPFGGFLAGVVSDNLGRIRAMHLTNIIVLIGLLMISIAIHVDNVYVPLLIFGRILTGLSNGLSGVSPIYMAEISSINFRAMFTSMATVFQSLGIFIVYGYGYFFRKCDWRLVPLNALLYPLTSSTLIFFFLPESPMWLMTKGNYDLAKVNMLKIYGKSGANLVDEDLILMIRHYDVSKERHADVYDKRNHLKFFKSNTVYWPFIAMSGYFMAQQFSGTMVIIFYTINMCEDARVNIDYFGSTLVIGGTRLLTSFIVVLFAEKLGRRMTTFISGFGIIASMYVLTLYLLTENYGILWEDTLNKYRWLPLTLLVTFVVFSTFGFLTVPLGMSAEVYPIHVRGFMVGLTTGTSYIYGFIAIKTYLHLRLHVDSYILFFLYGTFGLCGTIFLITFLPETRGKTFEEIEKYFYCKKKLGAA